MSSIWSFSTHAVPLPRLEAPAYLSLDILANSPVLVLRAEHLRELVDGDKDLQLNS